MFELIIKISSILNEVKDFVAGYGTKGCNDRMYVNYKGKHYMLKLVELDPIEVTDNDRKKHLNSDDDTILGFKYIDRLKYYD